MTYPILEFDLAPEALIEPSKFIHAHGRVQMLALRYRLVKFLNLMIRLTVK